MKTTLEHKLGVYVCDIVGIQFMKITNILLKSIFFFFSTTPTVYGNSQAKGGIGAVAAGLQHSHSNVGSALHV